jgi:hypothetical protein
LSIKITIGQKGDELEEQPVSQEVPQAPPITISLQISKLLNDDFLISAHSLVDIIIQRQKKKILVLPKEDLTEQVYNLQCRFFDYLGKHGIVDIASIQCGNIYGSLEGVIMGDDFNKSEQATILATKGFLDKEKPLEEFEKDFEREMELRLLHPDDEETTELGYIPHQQTKGTIQTAGFNTFGSYFFESKKKKC